LNPFACKRFAKSSYECLSLCHWCSSKTAGEFGFADSKNDPTIFTPSGEAIVTVCEPAAAIEFEDLFAA
jgi:hypothetical protein